MYNCHTIMKQELMKKQTYTAVCCGVLQCVPVCSSMLQCVAVIEPVAIKVLKAANCTYYNVMNKQELMKKQTYTASGGDRACCY